MILRTFTRGLFRKNRGPTAKMKPMDLAVCIDIECTCDTPIQIQPMEVIEIACLKLDLSEKPHRINSLDGQSTIHSKLDKCPAFHSFVKPVTNPELTIFCQELTGVSQSIVDRAEPVNIVIGKLMQWLRDEDLIDMNNQRKRNFAFASCGNFDLNLLSPVVSDCHFRDDPNGLPIYFKEWMNVKKIFVDHKKEWPKGLYHMLELLGESPFGRLHSAIDDCRNLARIVECLHADGCKFHVTSMVSGR